MINSEPTGRRLRLLVTIASFGNNNLRFLKENIQVYQGMPFEVDLIVLSNEPKDLGPKVKVVVGLPTTNPWSLPFAHKPVLAANVESYDLFIYSEDDMGVTEKNIRAFLDVTPQLAPDEIAGYLRYESDSTGSWNLPEVHSFFRWKPESVRLRGTHTVAEFSNEHAGFYILTQAQLKRAIASGGFLKATYRGRYGIPESAATDPYTSCGFRKVICISTLDDFLIHHQSNRYVGHLGLPLITFRGQIQTLMAIAQGAHPATTLCETESKLDPQFLSKQYYEAPRDEVINLIPATTKDLLSIGCGWGAAEGLLMLRGIKVTALPLNSVIGSTAQQLGIEIIYGTLAEGLRKLGTRRFDCVLITNLLHLLPDSSMALENCASFVQRKGTMVLHGPNFSSLKTLVKKGFQIGSYAKLSNYEQSGVWQCGPKTLYLPLRRGGLQVDIERWLKIPHTPDGKAQPVTGLGGKLTATDWVVRARR